MTEPTQDLAARRREIVRAVADLSEKHDLPMPMDIGFLDTRDTISLRLGDNLGDGVQLWTNALGNGEVRRYLVKGGKSYQTFESVKSVKWAHDGPTWFDAYSVEVWSACDLPEGGAE